MQRITRDKTVPPQKRYRVREPVARVDLGETFVVETINFRTPVIRAPEDANPQTYREREETGPIFVNGLEAGEVLRIQIEAIRPEGHASGGWWRDPKENSFLKLEDGRVHFPGGLSVPQRMMIGDIYVTPDGWPGGNPADNGGNMDFKDIAPGNALLLKAALPGGLLVLGDCHAAQGDGEILGLAAECAAEVTLTITKETALPIERPTILKPASFVSLACRKEYAAARDSAVSDARKILARLTGCTEEEAYLFVATVGDLRNGAVWGMGKTEPEWAKHLPVVVGVEVPLPAACVLLDRGGEKGVKRR
jgi:amidase